MGCEVADVVAEWQIFGKMSQICSFFGLFCVQTHPFCCCSPHGRPFCSSWEASVFYAVDHRFLAWKPLFSDVQTDGFRRTDRWDLQNKPMVSALNWRLRGLASGWSMWPWPLRKKLEKRCFYANLSLYHPICHPICHLLNMLYVNRLGRFGDRVTDFFTKKNLGE